MGRTAQTGQWEDGARRRRRGEGGGIATDAGKEREGEEVKGDMHEHPPGRRMPRTPRAD